MPRAPGPHGPPAWLMATILAVLCGLLAVASTIAASTARGGFSALWGRGAAAAAADGSVSTEEPSASPPEAAAAPEGPCPSGMVLIDDAPQPAFCIDRAEYPGLDRVPATRVDLEHARKACEVRGHALCTDDQWTRACRGRARWRYPYGPRHEAGRCRVGQGSGAPGNGGAEPNCVTPEGVLDLVGNVAEWTADGTVRGGSVRSDATVGCGSRERSKAKAESAVVGFRCCAPVGGSEPAAGSGEG